MPKVMINMEMPKSCGWCRFCEEEEIFSFCLAKDSKQRWPIPFKENRDLAEQRPSWCPLQEVKE